MNTRPWIAIVTPYFSEPRRYLDRCCESVRDQAVSTRHYMIGDGPEAPDFDVANGICHKLNERHVDYGETPRMVGGEMAIRDGASAIAYLDADNWFHPEHLSSLMDLHEKTGADVCTSRRTLHHLDETLLGLCETSDGVSFCDTNCLLFFPRAFEWLRYSRSVLDEFKPIHDRILWRAIMTSRTSTAHSGLYSVAYRTKYRPHYEMCGVVAPSGVYSGDKAIARALARWESEGNVPLHFPHKIRPAQVKLSRIHSQ